MKGNEYYRIVQYRYLCFSKHFMGNKQKSLHESHMQALFPNR